MPNHAHSQGLLDPTMPRTRHKAGDDASLAILGGGEMPRLKTNIIEKLWKAAQCAPP
jgi:hypothetical protein